MAKRIAIIALFTALVSLPVLAQDKQVFNHVGLGVTVGLDGTGLEVVAPATPYLQIRAGYSLFPYVHKQTLSIGKIDVTDTYSVDLSSVPLTGYIWKGGLGKLMLDIYPGKKTPFHFTAGAFVGSGKLASLTADLSSATPPEDYQVGIGIHNISISTDEKGFAYADAMVYKVMPYLGIGFGRAMDPGKRVTLSGELGVAYTGGIRPTLYDYSAFEEHTSVVTSSDLIIDDNPIDYGLVDTICGIRVFPMLKIGLFIRII